MLAHPFVAIRLYAFSTVRTSFVLPQILASFYDQATQITDRLDKPRQTNDAFGPRYGDLFAWRPALSAAASVHLAILGWPVTPTQRRSFVERADHHDTTGCKDQREPGKYATRYRLARGYKCGNDRSHHVASCQPLCSVAFPRPVSLREMGRPLV